MRRLPMDTARFVLVPEDSGAVAYIVDELPIPFRIDGARVIFSGQVAAPASRAAAFETPITLTSIRRQDGDRAYSY